MGHRFDPKHLHKLDNPERRKLLPPEEILKTLDIQPSDDIADIGCGPGYFTIPAAGLTKGSVYGVDVEPEMLNHLKNRAEEAHVTNIQSIQSDAEHIHLPDASVDKVMCSLVLHEVGDLNQVLSEFKRILRPNGNILIIEWEKKETESGPPLHERLETSELEDKIKSFGFQTEVIRPNLNHYAILAK